MIAKLPAPIRHLILVAVSAALTAAAGSLTEVDLAYEPIIMGGITIALAWVTPLIQSYGLGQTDPA